VNRLTLDPTGCVQDLEVAAVDRADLLFDVRIHVHHVSHLRQIVLRALLAGRAPHKHMDPRLRVDSFVGALVAGPRLVEPALRGCELQIDVGVLVGAEVGRGVTRR
jgi:hypothetical protein